jgi:hypothetical protein
MEGMLVVRPTDYRVVGDRVTWQATLDWVGWAQCGAGPNHGRSTSEMRILNGKVKSYTLTMQLGGPLGRD